MRRRFPRFAPENFHKNMDLVHKVEKIAQKKGCPVAQIAIAWVKEYSKKPGMPEFIPIPGASHEDRVNENFGDVSLSSEEMDEIQQIINDTPIAGDRYAQAMAGLNFGSSPPLQE